MIARIGVTRSQAVVRIAKTAAALFAVVGVLYALAHLEVVDEGESCAVTKWGKQRGVVGPGSHVRGLGEAFHCFNTRLTTFEAGNAVDADYTDSVVTGPTADGQEIEISYRVSFYVPGENVERVYREVAHDMDEVNLRVVGFYSRPKVRQVIQGYTAAQLYGSGAVQDRQDGPVKLMDVEQRMFDTLKPLFEANGIVLADFELGRPVFSPAYVEAVEARLSAEENVQIQRNNALAAQEEANRAASLAEGEARADVALAEAEATAIAVRGAAIRANPEVLELELIETLSEANVIYLPNDGITNIMEVEAPPSPTPIPEGT